VAFLGSDLRRVASRLSDLTFSLVPLDSLLIEEIHTTTIDGDMSSPCAS